MKLLFDILHTLNDGLIHDFISLQELHLIDELTLRSVLQSLQSELGNVLDITKNTVQLKVKQVVFRKKDFEKSSIQEKFTIKVIDKCISTNDLLLSLVKKKILDLDHWVLIANIQESGKGRLGREWKSKLGSSFIFSLVFRITAIEARNYSVIPLVVSVSCCHVLRKYGIPVQIKWPNDLVVGQDKMGGILVETHTVGNDCYFIVGVGINYNKIEEAHFSITSISSFISIDHKKLMMDLLNHLHDDIGKFLLKGLEVFRENYLNFHRDFNKMVTIHQDGKVLFSGLVRGITRTGALLLEEIDGDIREIKIGEVSLKADH